jgi:hypothetical protein
MDNGLSENIFLTSDDFISTKLFFVLNMTQGANPRKEYRALSSGPLTLSRRKLFVEAIDSNIEHGDKYGISACKGGIFPCCTSSKKIFLEGVMIIY